MTHPTALLLPPLFPRNAVALAAAWMVCSVQAQPVAPSAAVEALPEVVVSASRTEQRSFDAAAAVTRVDAAQLQSAGPQVNLSEALVRVPGLTVLDRQNYAQDLQISMRGYGARAPFGIRGIRLLIDGIPATTPDGQGQGSSVSLTSMEHIEVLRGPSALMYGNSSGGVIQAFTRAPSDTPELRYAYYTGSHGMHRADYQVSDTVGGYGIVADYATFSVDGYRANSQAERKQFNGALTFEPNAQTHVKLLFNQFDMPQAQDPLGLTRAQLDADPTQAGTGALKYSSRKSVLQNQLGGTLKYDLDRDHAVRVRSYYGTRDNLQFQAAAPIAGVLPATASWTGLGRAYYGLGLQYNAHSLLGDVPVDWAAGYEYDRSREYRQGGATVAGQKSSTTRSEDNQSDNSDLFAQGSAMVSEHVTLAAGLRASTVRFESQDYIPATIANPDGSGSKTYHAIIPMLGITYHASDTLNLYANLGGGFETPTLAEMAYSGTTAISPVFNTALNAASSQHIELGMKWLPARDSRIDLALYQITTQDEIVVNKNAQGQSSYKNAPATQRIGLELSGSTWLSPQISAMLSASTIDAQYTQSFSSNLPSGVSTVQAGNKLPGIPQTALFAELAWSGEGMPARKGAPAMGPRFAAELVQSGRLYANDTNADSADGHTVLNLSASQRWALSQGSIALYGRVNNLSDERYVSSVIVNQNNAQFYEPGLPRNWSLGVNLTLPL